MTQEVKDLTFEQAFGEPETTVQSLEAGDLTLAAFVPLLKANPYVIMSP
jgi:exonuclease VII small subunit